MSIISHYHIKEAPPPIKTIINQLFADRVHKRLQIDKSDFAAAPVLELNGLRREYSQMSQRSNTYSQGDVEEKNLIEEQSKIPSEIKRKIIRKELSKYKYVAEQKKIHEKYCTYLLNYLHKSNRQLIKKQIPPNLSVLQTIDQGDFIQNDDGSLYERKDFPHFSNVIKLHQIPAETTKPLLMSQPQKIKPQQLYFQIEDNCIYKIKHIYQFVTIIFKKSVQFSKKARSLKNVPQYNRMEEHQNHDFQVIAQQMGIHHRSVKLLYDMLHDFYDFDKQMRMGRGDDYKIKASKQIKQSLRQILSKHTQNQTVHIPHNQLYISLRQIRQLLHSRILQQQQQS